MSEFNRLIPRTDEERIEDLENALSYAQEELSRLHKEKDRLHELVAIQNETIEHLCKYITAQAEE